jgi:hypothetical protein
MTDHYEIATVPGSMPAASDTIESEGAADESRLNNVHKKIPLLTFMIKSIVHLPLIFLDSRIQRVTVPGYIKNLPLWPIILKSKN